MIDEEEYFRIVDRYYSFILIEFYFVKSEKMAIGNSFLKVEFTNSKFTIYISYENVESYLRIIVFELINGAMPSYDDSTHTLHLSRLNTLVMSKVNKDEVRVNAQFFSAQNPKTDIERKLLKGAKELRLCLKHLPEFQ
jgi:hypothetical protein